MGQTTAINIGHRPRMFAWAFGCAFAALALFASLSTAAATGKIQGQVVATDNGEPVG